jgi:hypothetical protein
MMLDSREIEEFAAPYDEIVGMWRKATRTVQSAAAPELDLDLDSRFTLMYQSALQGSTAVVRAAGYRIRGNDNHRLTFAAVAALGLGDLSEAARELNIIRQGRHAAVYDWESTTGPGEIKKLRDATIRLLQGADAWLRGQSGSYADRLAPLAIPEFPLSPRERA